MNISNIEPVLERRNLSRNRKQLFVKIREIDTTENESDMALVTDISDCGLSLITKIPLPVGTNIEISCDCFSTIGEICDWNWDYAIDMARLGVRLIEKHCVWPKDQ
jgi:hypothetical protein